MIWNNLQRGLIIFNTVLLVTAIALLASFYRLVPEDYYALSGNHQYGILKQAIVVCNQWGGRFFSYLFSFVLLDLYEKGISFTWYFVAGSILIIGSFFSIAAYFFKLFRIEISSIDLLCLACMGFIALFYLTPGIHESWFWVGASTSYYWGLVMAMAGTACLLKNHGRWYHTLAASMCFMYTCSASEPFALMILFFFLVFFAIKLTVKKQEKRLSMALVFCFAAAGFLLMLLSKGTADRWSAMPQLTMQTRLIRLGGAEGRYFIFWFPALAFAALLFTPVLFQAGNALREMRMPFFSLKRSRYFTGILLIYIIIIGLSFMPSCYVMGEAGPLRSWHHIGLYNCVFLFLLLVPAGYWHGKTIKSRPSILSILLVIMSFIHVIFWKIELSTSNTYAHAVDKRIAFLVRLQENHFRGLITLEKLPDPGYLFSAEIGHEKSHSLNVFLKKGLGLDYDMVVK